MPKYTILVTFHDQEIEIDTDVDYAGDELEGIDPHSLEEMSEFLEAAVHDGEIDLEPADINNVVVKRPTTK